jgi:hypothetical protein
MNMIRDGEVQDSIESEVTKPLLRTRPISSLCGFWPDMLLPLRVLYSPLLRLRFQSTFACCAHQVNLACGRCILMDPVEAQNRFAVEVEQFQLTPPLGTVYVQDSQWRKATTGAVQLFEDEQGVLASAIVRLPESEDTPYLTLGITMHEICHLMGLVHGDDPGSVMYSNAKVRPQILSDADAETLRRIYGKNNL